MTYTEFERKSLGAFYTPPVLAKFLADTAIGMVRKDSLITILDPATGDSALLLAASEAASQNRINHKLVGIDIESKALEKSNSILSKLGSDYSLILSDSLYPREGLSNKNGWSDLKRRKGLVNIDMIVSNPPWGADKPTSLSLKNDFISAVGQFDIYDLFIESSVNSLDENGIYAFIVPDSIFSQEHKEIRKLLLSQTTISRIVRLGEGFFPDANIAVTLIFGYKSKSLHYNIVCSHITNGEKKAVLKNQLSLNDAVRQKETKVSSDFMISKDYSFITDVTKDESELINILSNCVPLGTYAYSKRGVELSKKGVVCKCSSCGLWFPKPRKRTDSFTCPHCGAKIEHLKEERIIGNADKKETLPIIVGESIQRYCVESNLFIQTNYQGINYKGADIFEGPKIIIRKTGVGITATLDNSNALCNQVVYMVKMREDAPRALSLETIIAILCSRVTTYFIIKMLGCNGWKTHPYLSQKNIEHLPCPTIDNSPAIVTLLTELDDLVRLIINKKDHSSFNTLDAKIERKVAQLFNLNEAHYAIILESIKNVEPMIPFKRLLNISLKDIF